jgi:hypothetical protein
VDDGVTVFEYAECLLAIVFPSSLLWSMSVKNNLRGWTKLSCGNHYKPVSVTFLSLLIHMMVCVINTHRIPLYIMLSTGVFFTNYFGIS